MMARGDVKDHGFIQMWWRLSTLEVEWVAEYKFHPDRKWRFDVACVQAKVAIELEGIFFRRSHYEKMSFPAKDAPWARYSGCQWRSA